jgi:hypothetical protein
MPRSDDRALVTPNTPATSVHPESKSLRTKQSNPNVTYDPIMDCHGGGSRIAMTKQAGIIVHSSKQRSFAAKGSVRDF